MIQSDGTNLVFLFSTPRAGSTLASAILSNHPKVHCPNEPWLLLGLRPLYYGGNITHAPYDHSKVEAALRDFLSEPEFLEAARAFALTAYNQTLRQAGKTVLVDKTPRYYHILPFIERLFPAARKIWLQRNPLDVAASYETSWKLRVEQLFNPQFGPMCFDLTLGPARMAAFFQGQPHTHEFRYEDLVSAPIETIGTLCDFLGVPRQAGLEQYGAHGSALDERKRKRMGDDKLFAHGQPHKESIGRWRTTLTRDRVQRMLDCTGRRVFLRMGYADTIHQLEADGFRFPAEEVVDANLKAFEDSARWLPWANPPNGEPKPIRPTDERGRPPTAQEPARQATPPGLRERWRRIWRREER